MVNRRRPSQDANHHTKNRERWQCSVSVISYWSGDARPVCCYVRRSKHTAGPSSTQETPACLVRAHGELSWTGSVPHLHMSVHLGVTKWLVKCWCCCQLSVVRLLSLSVPAACSLPVRVSTTTHSDSENNSICRPHNKIILKLLNVSTQLFCFVQNFRLRPTLSEYEIYFINF